MLPQDGRLQHAVVAVLRPAGEVLDLSHLPDHVDDLDAGQCNDRYSLVVIAQALAKAFGVGINDLTISYNIAWYEQKAVLVETFGIRKDTTVAEDLKLMVPEN